MLEGTLGYVAVALLLTGGAGVAVQTVRFVRVTIPENHGANPGFGAYEVTVVPWWLVLCLGVGLGTAWKVAGLTFVVAIFGSGVLAQLLGAVFGRQG